MSQSFETLRDQLLNAEPPDPARQEQLLNQIGNIFQTPLTTKSRFWWIFSLVASILFAVWGALIVFLAEIDVYLRVVWSVYTVAQVAFIVYACHVLRSGFFRLRHFLRFITFVSPGGSLLCAATLSARAARSLKRRDMPDALAVPFPACMDITDWPMFRCSSPSSPKVWRELAD